MRRVLLTLLTLLLFGLSSAEAGRLLVRASLQYLTHTGAVVTAAPFTVCLWVRTPQLTAFAYAWSVGDISTTSDEFGMYIDPGVDDWRFFARSTSAAVAETADGSIAANVWVHVCGQERPDTETNKRVALVNGTAGTPSTVSRIPVAANIDTTRIGYRAHVTTPADTWDGDVAHAAVWQHASAAEQLSAAELTALAAGTHPTCIRPLELVSYTPLWGIHSPEINAAGSNRSWTLTGTPARSTVDPPVGRACR